MSEEPKTLDPSEGGKARWKGTTKKERSEAARKAANARWAASLPVATHGSPDRPLVIAGVEIQAYVLEDGTRVLTQGDFQEAIGRHRKASVRYKPEEGEAHTPPILQGKGIKPFIPEELMSKSEPIRFRTPQGAIASGYRAEILPQVCEVFLKARDADVLQKQQKHIAIRADILVRGLAAVGIIALVDEVTGYQRDRARNALAKILEAFIAKEIRPYAQTFDPEFYEEMFRLKGLPFTGTTKRPRYFGHLTNAVVYARLAPGVLQELRERNPVEEGRRKAKHFQWLTTTVGHPRLEKHLGAVVALMSISKTWDEFYVLLNKHRPKQTACPLYDHLDDRE